MPYFPLNPVPAPAAPKAASIIWEEVDCLLCGGRNWQTLLEAQDWQSGTGLWFAVVQCHDCGLCFTNPRPSAESLGQFYPSDYRPHRISRPQGEGPEVVRFTPGNRDRAPLPWHGQGRLLDFGCGGGAFLRRMRAHGWSVVGLDNSQETVEQLRSETDLEVLHGTLPHPELDPGSFDVITMWHSLEHVPEPKLVLWEARRLLTRDGKLVIAVPNIDSLAFRMFGAHWFGLDLPRHLTHFAPWTLQLMLERMGFRVERLRMVRRSAWLRHSARLACHHPQANLWHRLMCGKALSRLVAFYSCVTRQSDSMLLTATPSDT